MTTLDTLYASIAQSPDDPQTRSVLADWYEEAGDQHAADALRWTIRHAKRPFRSTMGTIHWFNLERITNDEDQQSNLPEPLYLEMQGPEGLPRNYRNYETLRAAYEDLFKGWRGAREKGWDGDA